MAKKTLNEAVVRRFQRLANLSPINEMYHKRDEEMEEGMYGKRDDEEVMKEEDAEMEMDAGAEMEVDAEMDAEEELMEALRGISYTPSRNEVVNEVAKRVAKRLKAAKLHESKLNRALGKK